GKPLTAADVKFTYDYLKKFPALDFFSIWTFITDVQAFDGQTVRFTLANPSSLAAEQISQLEIDALKVVGELEAFSKAIDRLVDVEAIEDDQRL
ncbi:ABC transporter substrate-binding protein, partial [Rhizobium ruizarguesonis]